MHAFASRAAEKLRQQDSVTGGVLVFAHTSPFREGPQFSRQTVVKLMRPTSDTRLLIKAASVGISEIYCRGYQLIKAGVMLLDIAPAAVQQGELDFGDAESPGKAKLMATMDLLNQRFSRGTVGIASAGIPKSSRAWSMKQERVSPSFTTRWAGLPIAQAG